MLSDSFPRFHGGLPITRSKVVLNLLTVSKASPAIRFGTCPFDVLVNLGKRSVSELSARSATSSRIARQRLNAAILTARRFSSTPNMQSRIRAASDSEFIDAQRVRSRAANLLNASTRNTPEPQLGSIIWVREFGAASPGAGHGRTSLSIISARGKGV